MVKSSKEDIEVDGGDASSEQFDPWPASMRWIIIVKTNINYTQQWRQPGQILSVKLKHMPQTFSYFLSWGPWGAVCSFIIYNLEGSGVGVGYFHLYSHIFVLDQPSIYIWIYQIELRSEQGWARYCKCILQFLHILNPLKFLLWKGNGSQKHALWTKIFIVGFQYQTSDKNAMYVTWSEAPI